MTIEEMAEFLEIDVLRYTFTCKGLKYLCLKVNGGDKKIELDRTGLGLDKDTEAGLIISETLKFLETGRHSMPLDLSSFTEFQQTVFEAVSRIEPGKIATYKDIACALGKPGAAQAVGNAVGKNPVAYFLPTHRVLPQKGIGLCRTGAGYLREKLLVREGHDLAVLSRNKVCTREDCYRHLM